MQRKRRCPIPSIKPSVLTSEPSLNPRASCRRKGVEGKGRMSSSIAAMLLRRRGLSLSSSPLFSVRRCIRSSAAAADSVLPRRPFASSSPEFSILSPRRGLASSVPSASRISADENLKRVIDSEIDCVLQTQDPSTKEVDMPEGFPFEIIDNPGDQSITLKREFAGETIKAIVYTNFDEEENLNEDDNQEDDDDTEDSFKPTIQMVVTIDKREGPILEFCCNFNDDELEIESMKLQNRDNPDAENVYNGPGFQILDESLQKALRKYLEVRGIKRSLYDVLYEYMMNKDEREYMVWLKNMKEFIEK